MGNVFCLLLDEPEVKKDPGFERCSSQLSKVKRGFKTAEGASYHLRRTIPN